MATPEIHRELKGAMRGAFRESSLAAIRGRVEQHLDRFLATAGGAPVEFIDAYARDAATSTMAALLGLDDEKDERLMPMLGAIGAMNVGESPGAVLQRQKGEFRLLRELTRVVRGHRADGLTDGLIGILLGAELEGEPLSDHDVALNCFNVVVAGTGASQHTLAGAAAVWADRSGDLADAAGDPKLTRRFVDETLRWLTPVLHLTRILTEDVEVSGQQLPKGAGVCLWNISANRDEAVFEDGSSFKSDRPPGRNLAFGAGPQYCLGAEIVRMQLEALLTGMVRHGVRFELVEPPTWMLSNTLAGVESLRLRLCR